MIAIEYVDKAVLRPRFGLWTRYANGDAQLRVRKDLPIPMQAFILAHEMGHERDKQAGDFDCDGWIANEIDANLYALKDAPWKRRPLLLWGFILTCLWSLAPYRLAY